METDWEARAAEVAAADGDEWDRLHDALETDWKAAYCAAFRAYAKERGWSEEHIESGWLDDMPREAFIEAGSGGCPETTAQIDVVECEIAAANA